MLNTQIKDLAEQGNKYILLRIQRLALEKQAEAIKEEEQKLRAAILEALKTSGAGGIAGKTHSFTLVQKTVPQVADWDALYEFIKKENAFELLQRRLSPPAVKERWEDKIEVPGVVPVVVEDLSITKL